MNVLAFSSCFFTQPEFDSTSSKAPQSRRLPDFSKVEPRVRFPKSGYMPPKSRPFSMYSSSAQPALMFKSPADIVKEVLLCGADGAPPSPDPTRPPTSGPNFTVPEDFRCPRQATTLVEQLQVRSQQTCSARVT